MFNAPVDRLLRLDRDDRKRWLSDVLAGLDVFPALAGIDRRSFLRATALYDVCNRLAFRGFTRFPQLARRIARLVPIRGARAALLEAERNRPIVLALMHFGPIHYVFTVLLRMVSGRTVYALHAGGEFGDAAHAYLEAIGALALVSDDRALRTVARAMTEDPHCAVVISFDYLGGRARKTVPFLGTTVPAARGLAFIAELCDALVVTAWGEMTLWGPRVVVGEALEIDVDRPKSVRQDELMERLFARLETRVRAVPAQWTEWRSCSPRARERA